MRVLHAAWALLYRCTASRRRRALPVVTAFAPQRLVGRCGRRAAASVAVVDIVFHVLVDLLEKESSLQTHLLDTAVKARDAQARAIIVLFDVVDAPTNLNAFAVICCLDRRWKVFLRERSRG